LELIREKSMSEVSTVPSSATENGDRPFEPSWIDLLIDRIEHFPGPPWLAYLLIFLASILINTAAYWLDGSVQFGTFVISRIAEVPLLISLLPLIHYLNNVAETALSEFRPIMEVTDVQYSSLRFQFSTLPSRLGWLSLAIGLPLAAMSVITSPALWQLSESSSLFMVVYRSIIAAGIFVFTTTFLFHTIHQLRMVDRLQRMPSKISLFQTSPIYALSSLTARTGLAYAMLCYYMVFLYYGLKMFGPQPAFSFVDLFTAGLVLLASVASFIIPLLGMHDRLVVEKARALYEANKRIELVIAKLHEQVDSSTSGDADIVNKNLSSLLLESETLSKMSTWPWKPETLRGLVGAITLPVVVWLITTVLDRILLGLN
jgi:hypothetical protein